MTIPRCILLDGPGARDRARAAVGILPRGTLFLPRPVRVGLRVVVAGAHGLLALLLGLEGCE